MPRNSLGSEHTYLSSRGKKDRRKEIQREQKEKSKEEDPSAASNPHEEAGLLRKRGPPTHQPQRGGEEGEGRRS